MFDLQENFNEGDAETPQDCCNHSTSAPSTTSDLDDQDDEPLADDAEAAPVEERDEVQEITDAFSSETCHINCCRYMMIICLWTTAMVLAVTTIESLTKQEERNFADAYEQVAATIGTAALAQQETMLRGVRSLADTITIDSLGSSREWPNYVLPYFEKHAHNMLDQTGMEVVMVANIVQLSQVDDYLDFVSEGHEQWLQESHLIGTGSLADLKQEGYSPFIAKHTVSNGGMVEPQNLTIHDAYAPLWGYSPPPFSYSTVNVDALSIPRVKNAIQAVLALKNETVLTSVQSQSDSRTAGVAYTAQEHAALHSNSSTTKWALADIPHTFTVTPIHETLAADSQIVGVEIGSFSWDGAWRSLLPDGVHGILIILSNSCGQDYTYNISGAETHYVGPGDRHDKTFDAFQREFDLSTIHTHPNVTGTTKGHCLYTMRVYPSEEFRQAHMTKTPSRLAAEFTVTMAFIVMILFLYDAVVQRRNQRMIESAARSSAIVTAMFPGTLRDKYMMTSQANNAITSTGSRHATTKKMKSFLSNDGGHTEALALSETAPLAELFLETTILFADIAGFTSWSSAREPSQVFTLLECIFGDFDKIAKPRRIFKVETVGDCYVAVAGIPEYRKDHAVAIARFARDAIQSFRLTTRKLDVVLGPDTSSDLGLRVGIHSGPVTAGILRGERARFQLFGDTMNTCSRMETTSESGRIHVSSTTAALLKAAGKETWVQPRHDAVKVKGKGIMKTFWLRQKSTATVGDNSVSSGSAHDSDDLDGGKAERLIDWNTEALLKLLKAIVSRRNTLGRRSSEDKKAIDAQGTAMSIDFLDELKECIQLPEFSHHKEDDPNSIEIDEKVVSQLRQYVASIASLYRDNPFHNFEHASHVTMSITKLLSRIVAPSDLELNYDHLEVEPQMAPPSPRRSITRTPTSANRMLASTLHDHTYGITSDPLTPFACAFSGLIHDVDHQGVPNTQLAIEDPAMTNRFQNRSIAEQNSLDLAWNLLMEPRFADLRGVLFSTPAELQRFRQLVVNCVMATDIADKGLASLRKDRWEKAFMTQSMLDTANRNRKATIVIEHLMQASDVSHTMQHWHVYRKWNQSLFKELFLAYKAGRATTNPAINWAKGEIGFFDFYVIPLAKKLKNCGVFGISSDEYLSYAQQNRAEWMLRGEEIVAEMVEMCEAEGETLRLDTETSHTQEEDTPPEENANKEDVNKQKDVAPETNEKVNEEDVSVQDEDAPETIGPSEGGEEKNAPPEENANVEDVNIQDENAPEAKGPSEGKEASEHNVRLSSIHFI